MIALQQQVLPQINSACQWGAQLQIFINQSIQYAQHQVQRRGGQTNAAWHIRIGDALTHAIERLAACFTYSDQHVFKQNKRHRCGGQRRRSKCHRIVVAVE